MLAITSKSASFLVHFVRASSRLSSSIGVSANRVISIVFHFRRFITRWSTGFTHRGNALSSVRKNGATMKSLRSGMEMERGGQR